MDIKRIPMLPGRWILLAMVDGQHFQAEAYRIRSNGKPYAAIFGRLLDRDTDGPMLRWLADCPILEDGRIIPTVVPGCYVGPQVLDALTADLKRYL